MSINAMTNVALARRTDFSRPDRAPQSRAEIAAAAEGEQLPSNPVSTALSVIVTYIPTEVLTLYVAVLAAIRDPKRVGLCPEWITFWCFLVATPLIVWLIYAAKVKSAGKPVPLAPSLWPVWEMSAATIAYAAWAFALPNAPFNGLCWYSSALAGVTVLVVSTALGLIAPLVQQPIRPGT